MGKKDVYKLLERDCVNIDTIDYIREYIEDITYHNSKYAQSNKSLGQELNKAQTKLHEERKRIANTGEIENLKQQLEAKENENRRLNLDAQKWFDMCMNLLHGKTTPEDYK